MSNKIIIPEEIITNKIYLLRKQKVMLDRDLAELYEVETKRLNEQVKRNIDRFPADFMFQLSDEEWKNLKSQNATTSWGGRRRPPYAFTEHGVLMLSSVLNSERSIAVNIHIMRVFTKIRELLAGNQELLIKMNDLESRVSNQDKTIKEIFDYLRQFVREKKQTREQIGFKTKGRR